LIRFFVDRIQISLDYLNKVYFIYLIYTIVDINLARKKEY